MSKYIGEVECSVTEICRNKFCFIKQRQEGRIFPWFTGPVSESDKNKMIQLLYPIIKIVYGTNLVGMDCWSFVEPESHEAEEINEKYEKIKAETFADIDKNLGVLDLAWPIEVPKK